MADMGMLELTDEDVQHQATAQQYLEEMSRLREQMQQSRREIELLRSGRQLPSGKPDEQKEA